MMKDIHSMGQAAELFREVQSPQMFSSAIYALQRHMKDLKVDSRYFLELEKRAYDLKNDYSEKDTRTNMEEAKNRVIAYIEEMMQMDTDDKNLTYQGSPPLLSRKDESGGLGNLLVSGGVRAP